MSSEVEEVGEVEISEKISNVFKEIISKIESYIDESSEDPENLFAKVELMSKTITSIIQGSLENATKDQYEYRIKELETILDKHKKREAQLKTKITHLETNRDELPSINSKDASVNEQLVYKLKKKLKEKEESFKYKEMLYLSRINELNKKIQNYDTNTLNTLSTNNELYSPEELAKCELFPNKKKTVGVLTTKNPKSRRRIQEKENSIKNFSMSHYSTYSMNGRTRREIMSNSSSDLRLFELYQKNRGNKVSHNNFLMQSNLIGIRNIIDEHNKNVVPPYNFKKPIKNYYSAFVKND